MTSAFDSEAGDSLSIVVAVNGRVALPLENLQEWYVYTNRRLPFLENRQKLF